MSSREQFLKENIKKGIIILAAIMVILIIFFIAFSNIKNDNSPKEYSSIQTVQDVVEYYGSKYISQDYSEEPGYLIDINVVFKVAPYVEETDEVNREYYENILEDIAKVLSYRSYIVIDDDLKGEHFRKYKTDRESFVDHSLFLKRKRYERLFRLNIRDYKGWARSLDAILLRIVERRGSANGVAL